MYQFYRKQERYHGCGSDTHTRDISSTKSCHVKGLEERLKYLQF